MYDDTRVIASYYEADANFVGGKIGKNVPKLSSLRYSVRKTFFPDEQSTTLFFFALATSLIKISRGRVNF